MTFLTHKYTHKCMPAYTSLCYNHTVCMYISYNYALKEPQYMSVSTADTNMYLKLNKKQNSWSMCDDKLGYCLQIECVWRSKNN